MGRPRCSTRAVSFLCLTEGWRTTWQAAMHVRYLPNSLLSQPMPLPAKEWARRKSEDRYTPSPYMSPVLIRRRSPLKDLRPQRRMQWKFSRAEPWKAATLPYLASRAAISGSLLWSSRSSKTGSTPLPSHRLSAPGAASSLMRTPLRSVSQRRSLPCCSVRVASEEEEIMRVGGRDSSARRHASKSCPPCASKNMYGKGSRMVTLRRERHAAVARQMAASMLFLFFAAISYTSAKFVSSSSRIPNPFQSTVPA
mmetsp:Transcript_50587/g.119833  ORF Transcript_50587/g.119833 Transcript_50587/m.119833 type:complete len:253 (-) Transcript_50587:413-1171(-)